MEHVFIGPEDISVAVLYQGFKSGKNTELILLNDSVRKAAKVLTMSRIAASDKLDFLLWPHYENTIGTCIEKRNWDDIICFILYGRIYESYGMSIIRYLRTKYIGCRIVVYLGDMVTRHKFDIEKSKTVFDKVMSFDCKDAEDYGLGWCLEPFSSNVLDEIREKEQKRKWDVTFVGAAKDRYEKVIKMYETLKNAGLTCDFHITGVKPQDRLYKDEIGYERMDFMSLLEHANSSSCIAEIVQDGGMSPTTRYSEAMLLGKNLLTDCSYFKDKKNRADNIFYFENVSELKNWNLNSLKNENSVERAPYKKMLSIREMIKTIDSML